MRRSAVDDNDGGTDAATGDDERRVSPDVLTDDESARRKTRKDRGENSLDFVGVTVVSPSTLSLWIRVTVQRRHPKYDCRSLPITLWLISPDSFGGDQ